MKTYSLENVITKETKVKVIFKYKIENFGFLLSETLKDIEAGVKVDIPIYIAEFLLENKHCTLVNEIIPDDLKNDIRANSSIINLNTFYTYFYYFISFFENNEYVIEIMFSRYNVLYKLILKERLDEDDLFVLDCSEKKIITTARKNYLMYRLHFIKN